MERSVDGKDARECPGGRDAERGTQIRRQGEGGDEWAECTELMLKDKQKSGGKHQESGYTNELYTCPVSPGYIHFCTHPRYSGRLGDSVDSGRGDKLLFSLGILCASRIRTVTHSR